MQGDPPNSLLFNAILLFALDRALRNRTGHLVSKRFQEAIKAVKMRRAQDAAAQTLLLVAHHMNPARRRSFTSVRGP